MFTYIYLFLLIICALALFIYYKSYKNYIEENKRNGILEEKEKKE